MPRYHLSQAVSADQALSSLRVLIIAGQNVVGTSAVSEPGELANRYLQWGEEALRQLRWLFGPKAEELVATWFYRDVAADRVRRRLAAGVQSELQARLAELEALVEEIADATATGEHEEMAPSPEQARTVFVVFGRNLAARNAVVSFLRSVVASAMKAAATLLRRMAHSSVRVADRPSPLAARSAVDGS